MSEPRIGRILVASLHQAIADLLPTRLDGAPARLFSVLRTVALVPAGVLLTG